MPALAYLLLGAPVEERYRAHTLLDINYLQGGPIHPSLLAHQLSETLALFFFAQVSRGRLPFFSATLIILRHRNRSCAQLQRIYHPRTRVDKSKKRAGALSNSVFKP